MQRVSLAALVLSAVAILPAVAQPLSVLPDGSGSLDRPGRSSAASEPRVIATPEPVSPMVFAQAGRPRGHLGGGFIEAVFGNGGEPEPPRYGGRSRYEPAPIAVPQYEVVPQSGGSYARPEPAQRTATRETSEPLRPAVDPKYLRQTVPYDGRERAGTIIINTRERFLYLVQEDGTAIRWGIGVGRPGFTWAGVHHVTAKREWPDWRPPADMLRRRPDLPTFMAGGPNNPLGARAMYLGSTLYRIHGSNEPWTIGQAVSSGCIRMRNEDVVDLYGRVNVGTRVIVI
jgi:lipoprotein-anchoring transpeptidase ErfK/SrfK